MTILSQKTRIFWRWLSNSLLQLSISHVAALQAVASSDHRSTITVSQYGLSTSQAQHVCLSPTMGAMQFSYDWIINAHDRTLFFFFGKNITHEIIQNNNSCWRFVAVRFFSSVGRYQDSHVRSQHVGIYLKGYLMKGNLQ